MATCPRCAAELPTGFGSVCPNCRLVIRIPGIVKLGLTLFALGFVVAVVWVFSADAVFASVWGLVNGILVQPLRLHPAPFALTGLLKQLYGFVFGTADQLPWGGILLIAAGIVVSVIGGAVLHRAEGGGSAAA
jgi:hypothetical protein